VVKVRSPPPQPVPEVRPEPKVVTHVVVKNSDRARTVADMTTYMAKLINKLVETSQNQVNDVL
jgi:hypothetical protein